MIWTSSREMLEFVSQYELRISASSDDESMRFDPRGSAKRCGSCSILMTSTKKESLAEVFPVSLSWLAIVSRGDGARNQPVECKVEDNIYHIFVSS